MSISTLSSRRHHSEMKLRSYQINGVLRLIMGPHQTARASARPLRLTAYPRLQPVTPKCRDLLHEVLKPKRHSQLLQTASIKAHVSNTLCGRGYQESPHQLLSDFCHLYHSRLYVFFASLLLSIYILRLGPRIALIFKIAGAASIISDNELAQDNGSRISTTR